MPLATRADDTLPPSVRRALIGAVLLAHGAGLCGLAQIGAVREAVQQIPIFAGLIQPGRAELPPPPPPPPKPVVRPIALPTLIAAAPANEPQAEPEKIVVPDPTAPAAIAAPEAPPAPPAPPSEPRTVSATDVSYLVPLQLTYPPLSRRLGEEGRVVLRVLVDPQGRPAHLLVAESSGYPRLDEAASRAARAARFRPYTENGQPQTVWVLLPFVFNLEESR
jgi:protein TonB